MFFQKSKFEIHSPHHTPPPPLMPERKIEVRFVFSLQENAVNGEHLWLETNVSGDLCYLGEESCQVRFAVSVRLAPLWSGLCEGALWVIESGGSWGHLA